LAFPAIAARLACKFPNGPRNGTKEPINVLSPRAQNVVNPGSGHQKIRPKQGEATGEGDLFRAQPDQIINMKHELPSTRSSGAAAAGG
jgi:hypothetical protein